MTDLAIPHRSSRYWYNDGSVVVQQSIEFKRAFNKNEDEEDEMVTRMAGVKVEGCDVYETHGITSDELHNILVAIDLGASLSIDPPPFDKFASILRGSQALRFSVLHNWCIRRLRSMWPDQPHLLHPIPNPDAREGLKLAVRLHLSDIMKSTCYDLVRSPAFGHVVESMQWGPPFQSPDSPMPYSIFIHLVDAREALLSSWLSFIHNSPALPPPHVASLLPAIRVTVQWALLSKHGSVHWLTTHSFHPELWMFSPP
ncbi:hypothetical protein A0H81_06567 [Grifola frondosa]|uniref:Uncharacterized protein n=1 Tax=Grifola frondosa TaxID=5627 RepID=A0A1C7M9P4_GRIFR|nr:hypothetical protein A0H81_06567 [Grifola frondosa]